MIIPDEQAETKRPKDEQAQERTDLGRTRSLFSMGKKSNPTRKY